MRFTLGEPQSNKVTVQPATGDARSASTLILGAAPNALRESICTTLQPQGSGKGLSVIAILSQEVLHKKSS